VQREITAPQLIDIHLPAGATFATALPAAHNAFVYVYRGCATIEGTRVESQRMAILANDGNAGTSFHQGNQIFATITQLFILCLKSLTNFKHIETFPLPNRRHRLVASFKHLKL
jgi:hypothetical protein